MNLSISDKDIFFTVLRSGKNKVTVSEGCVFYYGGVGSNMVMGDYDNLPFTPFPSYVVENYPGDSIGRHVFVDQQELEINGDTKIWLRWEYTPNAFEWNVSAISDGGSSIIADDPADDGNYDTGVSMSLSMVEYELSDPSLIFEESPLDDASSLLLAEVDFDVTSGEITDIRQRHEGIFIVNRYSEIVSTAVEV